MAKRGETRPWRMTYQWLNGPKGVQTFTSLEGAQHAARRQVETIGGTSRVRDCSVVLTHRAGGPVEHYRACPACGHWTVWDTEHEPQAWRHEWDSRWCEPIEGSNDPIMPPRWGEIPTGAR